MLIAMRDRKLQVFLCLWGLMRLANLSHSLTQVSDRHMISHIPAATDKQSVAMFADRTQVAQLTGT